MPLGALTNINGRLTHENDVPKTELGRAFRYGDGVFETILVRSGKPWFLDDHMDRLSDGMDIIGMDFQEEVFIPKIRRELERTIEANEVESYARARIHVYRLGGGAFLPDRDQAGYVIEVKALSQDPWMSLSPRSLGIYHHVPIVPSPLTRIKSANSLPYILGAKYAQANGWDDALMRSSDGYVIESTMSNLFIVHAATVFTPPVFGGCLPGIMRKNVIRVMRAHDVQITEKHLTHLDLGAANEIFLTNAIRGIVPVRSVEGTSFSPTEDSIAPFVMEWIRNFDPPKQFRASEN